MYDKETVELALEALELGFSRTQAAEIAGVSRTAVGRWAADQVKNRLEENGIIYLMY